MPNVTLSAAGAIDPHQLAEIRMEAMRPSLDAVGRFDPDRARQRFLQSYTAADTWLIKQGGDLAGFYVLRLRGDHLYLDHLYICPAHQGNGIGRHIVTALQEQAAQADLPIKLTALRESPANAFYRSCGFVMEDSDALDNYYVWTPDNLS